MKRRASNSLLCHGGRSCARSGSYQGNMTLYYFLLRAWIHLGDSEFVVRSLSVLFGVLTIPAVYFLAARLFDRPTGLTSAALLSVHSFHIHWSQETRAYTLLTLLLVLATYVSHCRDGIEPEARTGLHFRSPRHFACTRTFLPCWFCRRMRSAIVFPRPFRVACGRVAATAILFGILCAPMAVFVLLQSTRKSDQPGFRGPLWLEFAEFLKLLTSQGGMLLVVVYLALCGLAFLQTGRRYAVR